MRYATKFLKSKGVKAIISRTIPVETRVSLMRSTRAIREYGAREAHWEGLILKEHNLQSGELVIIGDSKYIAQAISLDEAIGELSWYAVRVNAELKHQKLEDSLDDDFNIVRKWETINEDLPAYGEIVTAQMRIRDPGLLQHTRYIFQVQKMSGIEMLDRIVFEGNNYRVDAINNIGLEGVVRIQLSEDSRP